MKFSRRGKAAAWGMLLLAGLWGAAAAGPPSGNASEESARKILAITVQGIINPVVAEFVGKAVDRAEAERAELLLLHLDTPGGLDTAMREIVVKILGSEVPVVVYVSPSGARAASAGVFITLAAHVAAMAPGTNIGAAHPVGLGGGRMDKDMAAKVTNDAVAYLKSIANKRGRNARWAELAVRESKSITAQEALKLGVIDLVAPDREALLKAIHGRRVETVLGKRILATRNAPVESMEMGMRQRFLNAISNPNVAYILMLLGFYGLFFELSSPGAIFPGVIGGICLILAFYAFQSLPVNYAGLLLILLAVALFVGELLVVSHGILTMGGIVAMVLGSLMLIDSPYPFMRISWSVIIPAVALTVLFFLVGLGLAVRVHRERSTMDKGGLLGLKGVAKTDLDPEGQVLVHGELWQAVSDEPVSRGEAVVVTDVEGLRLKVKRA